MCYTTKRRIADCVKNLAIRKEIRKITISDIMNETHMSRQSFYYYFKDIYDVLEWIVTNDLVPVLEYDEEKDFESWILNIFKEIEVRRAFLERVIGELPWNTIITYVKHPVERSFMKFYSANISKLTFQKKIAHGCEYFAETFCYYLMDYVASRKKYNEIEILSNLESVKLMLTHVIKEARGNVVYSA